jgi:hypothetical protein
MENWHNDCSQLIVIYYFVVMEQHNGFFLTRQIKNDK